MLNHIFSDRRSLRRIFVKIPMTYEMADLKTQLIRTKTVTMGDINESGVYFESDELLALRSEITLSFKLPKSTKIITGAARIQRIEVA